MLGRYAKSSIPGYLMSRNIRAVHSYFHDLWNNPKVSEEKDGKLSVDYNGQKLEVLPDNLTTPYRKKPAKLDYNFVEFYSFYLPSERNALFSGNIYIYMYVCCNII